MKTFTLPLKPYIVPLNYSQSIFELFRILEASSKDCFFFESLGPNKDQLSRYSIFGFDPEAVITGFADRVKINKKTIETKHPYEFLRTFIPQNRTGEEYLGGLVGYLSYESVSLFEPTIKLKANKQFSLFRFGLFTDGLLYDHLTGELRYFYYKKNRLKQINKLILSNQKFNGKTSVKPIGMLPKKTEHAKRVRQVLSEIRAGNVFQCEVGFKKNYQVRGKYSDIYRSLRDVNPSPYMYYVKFGKQIMLGSSPELLLSVKNGQMETF